MAQIVHGLSLSRTETLHPALSRVSYCRRDAGGLPLGIPEASLDWPQVSRTRRTTAASNPGPGTPPRLFLALSRCSAVREPPGLPLPSRVCVRLRGAGLGLWGIRQTRYARQARRGGPHQSGLCGRIAHSDAKLPGAPAQVGPRRRWSAPVGVQCSARAAALTGGPLLRRPGLSIY